MVLQFPDMLTWPLQNQILLINFQLWLFFLSFEKKILPLAILPLIKLNILVIVVLDSIADLLKLNY